MGAVAVPYQFNRVGMNPCADARDTIRLSGQLKEIAPDLVFSYFVKPVIFRTLAAALAGVKQRTAMLEGLGLLLTEFSGKPAFKLRVLRTVQSLLYGVSLPLLDQLVFLNPDVVSCKQHLGSVFAGKDTRVTPNSEAERAIVSLSGVTLLPRHTLTHTNYCFHDRTSATLNQTAVFHRR